MLGYFGTAFGAAYTITPLGLPDGAYASFGMSVNNHGDVAGYYYATNGTVGSFIYSAGVMRDLGSLGTIRIAATGINDAGHVVGYYDNNGYGFHHAFLYDGTTLRSIDADPTRSSFASAINNSGLIVGTTLTAAGRTDVFTSTGINFSPLGLSNMASQFSAEAVNDRGQIAGAVMSNTTGNFSAYVYDAGLVTLISSPAWSHIGASAINLNGWVVGSAVYRKRGEPSILMG